MRVLSKYVQVAVTRGWERFLEFLAGVMAALIKNPTTLKNEPTDHSGLKAADQPVARRRRPHSFV